MKLLREATIEALTTLPFVQLVPPRISPLKLLPSCRTPRKTPEITIFTAILKETNIGTYKIHFWYSGYDRRETGRRFDASGYRPFYRRFWNLGNAPGDQQQASDHRPRAGCPDLGGDGTESGGWYPEGAGH